MAVAPVNYPVKGALFKTKTGITKPAGSVLKESLTPRLPDTGEGIKS